jgi:hypothetical protein
MDASTRLAPSRRQLASRPAIGTVQPSADVGRRQCQEPLILIKGLIIGLGIIPIAARRVRPEILQSLASSPALKPKRGVDHAEIYIPARGRPNSPRGLHELDIEGRGRRPEEGGRSSQRFATLFVSQNPPGTTSRLHGRSHRARLPLSTDSLPRPRKARFWPRCTTRLVPSTVPDNLVQRPFHDIDSTRPLAESVRTCSPTAARAAPPRFIRCGPDSGASRTGTRTDG